MVKTSLILAAGQGTRMKSTTPKVLHEICGKPMLHHVLDAARDAGVQRQIVVVGHGAEEVMTQTEAADVQFVKQTQQWGTGHAVMVAEDQLPEEGMVLVLCGDTPLITEKTLRAFMEYHQQSNHHVSVLSARFDNPYGYGRILRTPQGDLARIVEEKDGDEEIRRIQEVNSGIYCFQARELKQNLKQLTNDNAQQEYYLTQLIEIAVSQKESVGVFPMEDPEEILGVNTRVQLAEATSVMRKRINVRHMLEGVTMIDPASVYIDTEVRIGRDTILYPGVVLKGNTHIGEGCQIGAQSRIENSTIGAGTVIQSSTILDSQVGENTTLGPWAYLRPNSRVGNHVKIGDFVEVKNSTIGDGSKASHLAYIGDADVGREVNIGCGVVFVNYDGIHKFRSVVEDEAFVGSNANLVAPVHVEKQGYVAAGTTISKDVPEGALVVGRPETKVIPQWGAKKRKQKKEKENAK